MFTSGLSSDGGGGDSGSLSSGIVSCTVPFIALELGAISSAGSGLVVPFGLSLLDWRVCLGELEASEARGVEDSLLNGDAGRPAEDPGGSRSFALPLPNPPNAELKLFEEVFLSGEDARPYGCVLCLRRPNTVPKRLRLCRPPCFGSFTGGVTSAIIHVLKLTLHTPEPLF